MFRLTIPKTPLPAAITFILVIAAGVCSPAHAQLAGCCTPNSTCVLLTRTDCILAGGAPYLAGFGCAHCDTQSSCNDEHICNGPGNGTNSPGFACTDSPCDFGACCMHGVCAPVHRLQCADPTNLFSPSQACTVDACIDMRACCNSLTGTCIVTTPVFCEGALVRTSFSTCGTINCSLGACCNLNDGLCFVIQSTNCLPPTQVFQGFLTGCASLPCHSGACCDNTNGLCIIGGPSCPTSSSYTYQGDNTDCFPSPCPVGACCSFTTGLCTYFIQSQCASIPGSTFQGGGVPCSPTPCLQGACCRSDGSCVTGIPNDCPSPYVFTYSGDCASSACNPSACCTGSGSCALLGRFACSQQSGAFHGGLCSANPCTQGACCSGAGSCASTLPANCSPLNTFYAGQSCSPSACATGACCATSGQCGTAIPRGQCLSVGGIFVGGVCSPNPCSIGRCCLPDGACVSTVASQCAAPATFSPGQPCGAVNPCPQPGVCCRGVTCSSSIDQPHCTVPAPGIGTSFVLGLPRCNTTQSATSPCCYADFDKSGGVQVNDIFAFLHAWFAMSPFAKVGGDGVVTPTVNDIFAFLASWFAGCA